MTGASAPQGDHLGNLEESPGSEGLGTVDPVGAPEIYSRAEAQVQHILTHTAEPGCSISQHVSRSYCIGVHKREH